MQLKEAAAENSKTMQLKEAAPAPAPAEAEAAEAEAEAVARSHGRTSSCGTFFC